MELIQCRETDLHVNEDFTLYMHFHTHIAGCDATINQSPNY